MTTYTQSSHPLDIAAGITSALDTDDLRHMLTDVLARDVLDALTEWIDGLEAEKDEEIETLEMRIAALSKKAVTA